MNGEKLLSAAILLICLLAAPAAATEIYRWVDAEGVTHFSDTRPDNVDDSRSLHVSASNPAGYDPADDPYSIVNQAKRINVKWSALSEERERRAQKRRERLQYAVQYEPARHDSWRYVYRPGHSAPARPLRPVPNQFRAVRQQANALEALNLTGSRPHSINSGAHAARVKSSRNFPRPLARPAPLPRRP